MEFKQLEAYVAVIDYNSFSEAAKHLELTQPTISAHVNSLEKELNSKLIIRTTKKMVLTARGQQFYEGAANILNIRNHLIKEFTGSEQKQISVGASTIPSSYILPDVLEAFSCIDSDTVFNIWQADSKKVINKVMEGSLDFGLTGMKTDDESCVFIPFFRDELVIAAPVKEHYLKLKEQNADLSTLMKEPFIMRENGSGTQKEINNFLSANKINITNLRVIARMNDLESIKYSIARGLGISILSTLCVRDFTSMGKILEFPLTDEGYRRNLYIVYNRHRVQKPHVKQLIDFLKNYYNFSETEKTI
ncbi:MAG: selenium metabolism-associated LysR family transcriptional regulator [Lachnospiraceae bacterium]|nr:selenium metabolism-associated LysR family transcriptional regulator [Lachnospiraceae bacterium]MDY4970543.1 selenium metabolism-associated LysR family transcriptional regulator [Lachnospiraceae bacterium]